MNRRSFLTALFGGIAATAVGTVVASEAAKASQLPLDTAAKLDETPSEFTQYYRGRPYRGPRRRRQVCTVTRDRFGRRRRVCRWVY
ncbi:hypothetical protein [Bosea sp. (in: a-proteobacteria)]|jgi:hypothetical protein|uniref:hypothetical protein n=1 Tax=Bosea sp. (in: a-proteobacteria) TaxID=1871050 RepID=UPI001AC286D8|nr:hypothetical protein [Bosea sp. (in: a-proteobacteria)]MBN9439604.1 hypothetical protein [Bosea sp. (in: a-proteobacteria)]MBN9469827.1 hypothetical protein [Bosea sp. (in: a-proteobacteria)]